MTNTQRRNGVGTLTEQKNFYIDELAKAIAAMFDSGDIRDVFHKLYEPISKANNAVFSEDEDLLQWVIDFDIEAHRSALEEIQELMKRGDLSEMIAARSHLPQEKDEKFVAGFTPMIDRLPDSHSDLLDYWLRNAEIRIAYLTEIESIDEMTGFVEKCKAYADYYAKNRISEIIEYLMVMQMGGEGTLETKDIQHAIKTNYLERAHHNEMRKLAEIFGRDDIIRGGETPNDRMLREVKEEEITKLLKVLRHMITHKDTQTS